jgi:hypothetical protein
MGPDVVLRRGTLEGGPLTGVWSWGSWVFRRETDERGRIVYWARDSRPSGPREVFDRLKDAVAFAVREEGR